MMVRLIALFIVVAALTVGYAYPRDDGRYANSPLKDWFDQLRSKGGVLCCTNADGTALSDGDWDTKDGHYRVRVPIRPDGELVWVVVPDEAVVIEPNRSGRTMVWPLYGYSGVSIRCFMPGALI